MHRSSIAALAAVLTLCFAATARAEAPSPVGAWKTIDDKSKLPRSIVRITEKDGKLVGVIEKLFPIAGQPDDPICDKCEGARKDQKVVGMTILWDLVQDGDEWSGGRILDPENGKTYKCYIEVVDGGKKLKVRGYLGISMFGRTQHWLKGE
jgi:uncharacterized protein (DUF2147 family)